MKGVYFKVSDDQSLSHHGILGQKWGKRNGPPYPLGASDHSSSEKKAGWRKSLDQPSSNNQKKETKKQLTQEQKKKLTKAGAIAIGSVIAVAGGVYLYKTGRLDNLIEYGDNTLKDILSNIGDQQTPTGEILGIGDNVTLDPSFHLTADNAAQCASGINPSGSRSNCGSVASAILMNTMGGNYQALAEIPEHMRPLRQDGSLGNGYDPKKLIDCFEGGKWSDRITDYGGNRRKVTKELENKLLSQGDGAKGIFYCEKIRNRAYGHFFCYTIIDNTVHVLEGQPPSAQSSGIDWCKKLYDEVGQLFDVTDGATGVFYARLDNCPVKPGRGVDLFQPRQ